jgi:hypothetical protein
MIRRRLAMRLAFVNRPEGRGFVEAYAALMINSGIYTDIKGMSKEEAKKEHSKRIAFTAVSWLYDKPERLEILRKIRDSMTPGERARLNNPISARQRVEKVIKARERGPEAEAEEKDSPLAKAKRRVAELERDLAEAQAKLARKDDGSLFDLRADRVEDMAATVAANMSEPRAMGFSKAIAEAVKARKRKQQKPAG